MVQYICSRCNYNTIDKSKFKRHLLRKKKCKCIKENVRVEEIWKKYFEEEYDLEHNRAFYSINKAQIEHNRAFLKNNKLQEQNRLGCKYCSKKFAHYQSRHRHEKNNCKEKKNQIIVKNNELDELKKKISELENKSTTTNNMINSNNTINVINLRAYNDPNMEHIDMKYLNNLFKKLPENNVSNGLFELIKDTHCNTKYKENLNIVLPSLKNRKFIKIFDGKEWKLQLRKQIFDEIITKYFKFNENIIEEIKKNPQLQDKFIYLFYVVRKVDIKYDEDFNDEYKKIHKDLCDKLEVEFHNNKEIID